MSNPLTVKIDTETNTTIVREMTDEEYAKLQADQAAMAASIAQQQEEPVVE